APLQQGRATEGLAGAGRGTRPSQREDLRRAPGDSAARDRTRGSSLAPVLEQAAAHHGLWSEEARRLQPVPARGRRARARDQSRTLAARAEDVRAALSFTRFGGRA